MPVIHDHQAVVARAVRLAEAAALLDVPVRATEQNPAGLGPTVPPLAAYPQEVLAKTTFSAAGDPGFPACCPLAPARSSWPAARRTSASCRRYSTCSLPGAG